MIASNEEAAMSDMSLPRTSAAESSFRVGDVMFKSVKMLLRNLLPFGIVTGVAALPQVLLFDRLSGHGGKPSNFVLIAVGAVLTVVLMALSQAVVLQGAFECMRGGRPDVRTSFKHAWRRLLPVIGVALLTSILSGLAFFLLVFPALMLITAWYIATPACVVEQTSPWQSLKRSEALTDGHRWKVFSAIAVLAILSGVGGSMLNLIDAGTTVGMVTKLIWYAFFGAYSAILGVVMYHDLRAAKEGVNVA
jgi:hypothetical protein